MPVSRRKFIQLSSLASAALLVPKFLKAFEYNPMPTAISGEKVLVIIQLSGGNDGLNTIIPYRNDIYYGSRPKLAIDRASALSLNDDAGIHPALQQVKSLYDQGFVSILNDVGYPRPDRSHFRSMDIWQTGSRADELLTTGWIGRYLDGSCADCDDHNTRAIEVDDTLSLAMKGRDRSALAVSDVNKFYKAASDPFFKKIAATHAEEHEAQLADYLYKTLHETVSSADYVFQQSKIYKSTQVYPDTALGKRMKTIGSLINAHADTKVYYVSHGSFDTHVGQSQRQEQLFKDLDNSIAALVADLKQNNRFSDVLIMTFSEFGRRVAQNASNGTDHGTANNMFMISGGLKKAGLYNPLSDLTNLDEGDLRYQLDFKQVYATILDNWLDGASRNVLNKKYQVLDFV
ncbi:DUF1501 domain-containing protein [Taibaiella soli]|uniref:Twin-arginine translocation pathway signal n=1 Tax=Taibaiella soli TaxID=1649169 RepID=A0A2W2B5K1_9BACT|nr:DUF1501 domain-containing protein [Taibaiella soli]PZF71479.1 twin-arginine translocation pathway signal [Taibaiella soli]